MFWSLEQLRIRRHCGRVVCHTISAIDMVKVIESWLLMMRTTLSPEQRTSNL